MNRPNFTKVFMVEIGNCTCVQLCGGQEQWEHDLRVLFTDLPVVLDDDEKKEQEREEQLVKIRGSMASRYMLVSSAKENKIEMINSFIEHIASLKEMHGQDMAFPPWPSVDDPPATERVRRLSSSSNVSVHSATSSSASSSSHVLNHKLFYLCQDGTVWTVVQARLETRIFNPTVF